MYFQLFQLLKKTLIGPHWTILFNSPKDKMLRKGWQRLFWSVIYLEHGDLYSDLWNVTCKKYLLYFHHMEFSLCIASSLPTKGILIILLLS